MLFHWGILDALRLYFQNPFGSKSFKASTCYIFMQNRSAIEKKILETAIERGVEKSTCPSEIARMMFPANWRRHMEEIRNMAIELHVQDKVLITQRGEPVDVNHIKGPIRIKIR